MTRAPFHYDFGDTACTTPLLAMHTLGHAFIPPPIHAGGLRYHGMAPIICRLMEDGFVEARAYHQNEVLAVAHSFAKSEGFIVAPETAHALKATYDEAMACKESGESKVLLFNCSGHGHFDLAAYDAYHRNDLPDYELEAEELELALAGLPKIE